jgi:photosystem II stability/assembly factor-like uncharacterized protein
MFKPLRLVLLIAVSVLLMAARMPNMRVVPWEQVEVPTQNILLDIAFTGTTPSHGWLVGDKATLLESRDGGSALAGAGAAGSGAGSLPGLH